VLKIILFTFLSVTLFAQGYHFSEERYSDAVEHTTKLEGEIKFTKNGLVIKYPQKKQLIEYKDEKILFLQDSKIQELKETQASNMMRYFDMLIMLHADEQGDLEENFDIKTEGAKTFLEPLGSIKYYIDHIELIKKHNELKHVKLFLKNDDYIIININDEI